MLLCNQCPARQVETTDIIMLHAMTFPEIEKYDLEDELDDNVGLHNKRSARNERVQLSLYI